MTKLGPYTVHPAADAYPLIDGEEFDKLVESIRTNGLREPLVLTHDRTVLVDGRNRYRACEKAGVKPAFTTLAADVTELDILALVVDRNERRRDMNQGQKAMVALALEPMFAEAARKEQRKAALATAAAKTASNPTPAPSSLIADLREANPPSQPPRAVPSVAVPPPAERTSSSRAARAVGASPRAVQQAKAVTRDAPDLAEQVRSGTLALDAADKERKKRVAAMPKPEPAPKPGKTMLTLLTHTGEEFPYPQPKGKSTFTNTTGPGISWAEWSWNPVTGCLHGCNYCYARAIANDPRYGDAFPAKFTPLFHPERLDAPANTVVPGQYRDANHQPCSDGTCKVCAYRRVFVCSMADLYGRWVPDEWIKQVHASCLANPQWDYIHLTKFPDRYVGLDFAPTSWVGTSVDEQKRVRIAERAFRQIDGVAVKWLSLEPLTEPLQFTDLSMFDWVVIGAQTGTRQPDGYVPAFAPDFEWVARIALQAIDSGCKVHFKPNLIDGSPGMVWPDQYPNPGTREPMPEPQQIPGQTAIPV